MEGVRAYLLSVTAGAVLCAILKSVCGISGSGGKIVQILCGSFLLFTVIGPLRNVDIHYLPDLFSEIELRGENAVEEGKSYAMEARAEIIKSKAEAYILDKAKDYGAQISVDVKVADEEPQVPEYIHISGELSAYVRSRLSQIIIADLGISKEAQQWSP